MDIQINFQENHTQGDISKTNIETQQPTLSITITCLKP